MAVLESCAILNHPRASGTIIERQAIMAFGSHTANGGPAVFNNCLMNNHTQRLPTSESSLANDVLVTQLKQVDVPSRLLGDDLAHLSFSLLGNDD
jgi:hypothetical protein